MRSPLLALVTTLLLAAPALGQDAKPDDPKSTKEDSKKEPEAKKPARRGNPLRNSRDPSQIVEFLEKELDLTEKQTAEVRKIMDDTMAEVMKKAGEFFGSGNPEDMKKARKVFEDVRVTIAKRISAVLSPEQKREFEVLVEQFDRRAQSFEQSRRVRDDISQLLNPKPASKKIQMGKAERLLFLPPDETKVLMPFVGAVIDSRIALYEGRRVRRADLLNAHGGGASKKEIQQRVAEIRAAEQFQRLEIAAAQQRLRELLTIEQEVRFVAAGILD